MFTRDVRHVAIAPGTDFYPLVSERRSPFFGLDDSKLYDLFHRQQGTELNLIVASESEGNIFFRQFKQQQHVHLVLSGSLVLFIDEAIVERELYGRITNQILENCQYLGTLGPGQIVGTLEVLGQREVAGNSVDHSPLSAAKGLWMISGYAEPDSEILSIPVGNFLSMLREGSALDSLLRASDLNMSEFISRCKNEFILWAAQRLHTNILSSKKHRTALLALQFYEYYRREKSAIRERFLNSGYMSKVKVEHLSWLIGLKKMDASQPINDLINIGILERVHLRKNALPSGTHSRSSRFNFDAQAMRDYYLLASDGSSHGEVASKLRAKYKNGYRLEPLRATEA